MPLEKLCSFVIGQMTKSHFFHGSIRTERKQEGETETGEWHKQHKQVEKQNSRPLLRSTIQGHYSCKVITQNRQTGWWNTGGSRSRETGTRETETGEWHKQHMQVEKHNSRPLLRSTIQGHYSCKVIIQNSQAGWWNTGGSRSRDKRVTQRTKTSIEALFKAITQSRLSQRVIMQGNSEV